MRTRLFMALSLFTLTVSGLSLVAQTVKDIDGNTYKTLRIGKAQIMAENLRVRHYQNGSSILFAPEGEVWKQLGEKGIGACCFFNNDSTTAASTGLIYNYYVAADKRNVCPSGWRVPSKDDWAALLDSILLKHPEFIPKNAVRAAWGTRFNSWSDKGSLWSSTISEEDSTRGYALDFSYNKYLLTPFAAAGDGIRCIEGTANNAGNKTSLTSNAGSQKQSNSTGISASLTKPNKVVDPKKKMIYEKHVTATFPDTIAEKYSENNYRIKATSYKSKFNGAEYVIKMYEYTDDAIMAIQRANKDPHQMIRDNEAEMYSTKISLISRYYGHMQALLAYSFKFNTSNAIIEAIQVIFNDNDGCLVMVATNRAGDPSLLLKNFFNTIKFH